MKKFTFVLFACLMLVGLSISESSQKTADYVGPGPYSATYTVIK